MTTGNPEKQTNPKPCFKNGVPAMRNSNASIINNEFKLTKPFCPQERGPGNAGGKGKRKKESCKRRAGREELPGKNSFALDPRAPAKTPKSKQPQNQLDATPSPPLMY